MIAAEQGSADGLEDRILCECGAACGCGPACRYKATQRGLTVPVQLVRHPRCRQPTSESDWTVKGFLREC